MFLMNYEKYKHKIMFKKILPLQKDITMKKLPVGLQDFASIINDNMLYVDKTQYIYELLNGKYYFMSRPRRFGKSLLISTLKEIFSGNKEIFKDLWIYDKIEWKQHNVIKISFNEIPYKNLGLIEGLNVRLNELAIEFNIVYDVDEIGHKFKTLIRKLSEKEKVVILIDEYDKPIIDFVDNTEKATENRDILKSFYSILKDADAHIKLLFITGVSKFSKVSIFSDLNNLTDITIDDRFSCMTGIKPEEMEKYFSDRLPILQKKFEKYIPDVKKRIESEYLGYSWDGENYVYNPFTLLTLFEKNAFGDYWFASGTPTFLMKLIKEDRYTAFDLENKSVFLSTFDKFEIDDISLLSLLFQTGYLTIKELNPIDMTIKLDYPNNEVERAFTIHLLANLNGGKSGQTNAMLVEMMNFIRSNNIEKFLSHLKILFKGIAYPLIDDKEKYYHSIFYLVVKMLGFNIESEVLTIDGRIDCVLKTEKIIYIIEFKIGNTKKAIDQIKEKGYHLKYVSDKRQIQLLGIDFDTETKQISEWILVDVEK